MRALTPLENLRLGAGYLLGRQKLYSFPDLAEEQIADYQLARIKHLVRHAFYRTEFYRDLYRSAGVHPEDIKTWDDFRMLPTITKDDVITNHDRLIAKSRSKAGLIVSRSSGSSGKVLDVIHEGKSFIDLAQLMIRMFRGSFDLRPFDRQAFISTSKYPYRSLLGMYRVEYIYTLTPLDELIDKLETLRPDVIVGYPSILLEMIRMREDWCRRRRLKAISTNSEHSTQKQRDFIASVFGCPVFDEYSTEELNWVAYQCRHQRYHLQEDCSYIEILDPHMDRNLPDDSLGEIVGTHMVKNAMPFIRYRQGDLGKLNPSTCVCNNRGRELSKISGRKNSSFKLPSGDTIPSGRILDWTYQLLLEHSVPFHQFKIVQTTLNSVEFIFVPVPSYNSRYHDGVIVDSFKRLFGDAITVSLREAQIIEKTAAGKHIPIESRLD